MIEFARKYAIHGWPVIPVYEALGGGCSCGKSSCTSPGKHPRTRSGLKEATTDLKSIHKWWERHPNSSIGLVTGKTSGLVVLDIDLHKGGEESFDKLLSEIGELPPTLIQKTGSGGAHYFFQYPEGSTSIRNGVNKLGPGIDVRGEGGYVVAPPSSHICGQEYEWNLCPFETAIAPLPSSLLVKIEEHKCNALSSSCPSLDSKELILEGRRNSALTSLGGKLRSEGKSRQEIHIELCEVNAIRCHPPLNAEEVMRIAESVSRYPINSKKKAHIVYRYRDWIFSADGPEKPMTRYVLSVLTRWMNSDGRKCFPNISDVAAVSKCSEKTVRTHLNLAVNNGWLGRYEKSSLSNPWKSYGYFVPEELLKGGK